MPMINDFQFDSIDIFPVRAESIDIKNMDFIRQTESSRFPNVAFLVKFIISGELIANGLGMEIFFEDYAVRKFNECSDGVFFKVYNPRFLSKHSGKEIFYSISGNEKFSTGLFFPDSFNKRSVFDIVDPSVDYPTTESLIR